VSHSSCLFRRSNLSKLRLSQTCSSKRIINLHKRKINYYRGKETNSLMGSPLPFLKVDISKHSGKVCDRSNGITRVPYSMYISSTVRKLLVSDEVFRTPVRHKGFKVE
jgi:hypothetical protein